MHVPFEQLPNHARVWIYQANRALTHQEVEQTLVWSRQFVEQWAAHGQDLYASVNVLRNHFVVIALDEQHHAASGCSIDSSVGFVRALEESFGKNGPAVNFFDRTLVAIDHDRAVKLLPLADIKSQIADGHLPPATLTFNNLIKTKAELESNWLIPIRDSWLARYLPKVEA